MKKRLLFNKEPYLFIAPALLIIFIFMLVPIFLTVFLSVTDANILTVRNLDFDFIGFSNYLQFLRSGIFENVVTSTIIFVFGSVILTYVFGMYVAILLNQAIRLKPIFRGILILPWAVPQVVLVLIWKWMVNPQYGVLKYFLVGPGLVSEDFTFLGNPNFAMLTLLIVSLWRSYPLASVILLAGLKTIPEELYEAASIDGANPFQKFIFITLPGLRYVSSVLVLLLTIWSVGNFVIIWLMTGGGPADRTAVLAIYSYINAFKFTKLGYGAAIGMIALLFSLAISIIYYRLFMQRQEQEK